VTITVDDLERTVEFAEVGEALKAMQAARPGKPPVFKTALAEAAIALKVDTRAPTEPAPVSQSLPPEPKIAPSKVVSDWGKTVVDEEAKKRLETLHESLRAKGVQIDASKQLYGTGTRMAKEGYETQHKRRAEHDAKTSVEDAAGQLIAAVEAEHREDRIVTAKEFAQSLAVNGAVTAFGRKLTEQALRGLSARLKSPMLGYLLGLRDRIAAEHMQDEKERDLRLMAADKERIAQTVHFECLRKPDVQLKLRVRSGQPKDVFAIVSPSFGAADAPEVLDQVLGALPKGTKGSWSYDPDSTSWELRAECWTPTPVDLQAVGEPFEAYVSFHSRDNGTSRFRGGGGINILRCLNASTYSANSAKVSRVHRGNVMYDIKGMLEQSVQGMHTLIEAWVEKRESVIAPPDSVPLEVAIPGFWQFLLRDRSSELVGVLPGRKDKHVQGLTAAYFAERRDTERLVRTDLANGWTKYIQDQDSAVRRDAEVAIGGWLVKKERPIGCLLAPKEDEDEE